MRDLFVRENVEIRFTLNGRTLQACNRFEVR